MAPMELLERAAGVSSRVSRDSRISVTELSRGTDWRKRLPDEGIIEVTDRGDTAAWLVSDKDMQALVKRYSLLEEELERAQISAIFRTREDARPKTGNELKQAARAAFAKRGQELSEIIDGD
ncbi:MULTISPECIES: hypothetical protein [unclassified Adlercreutzia]|uniref:hypothetical protein n=1 Tax=unclassified Adlercreutzia TaxID=2636013 RepID=UPI0013EDE68B|nr:MULTISPECIES: hypothetical protein [unclassified Adlercreutzia]